MTIARSSRPSIALAGGAAFVAVAAALCLASPDARANGRFPAANQIVVSPVDANVMLTRSTFGLLLSKDRGQRWDWICEDALGFTDTQDPALGILTGNAIIAGTYGGLVVSPDTGCGWRFIAGPLAKVPIIDIVARRDTPGTAYALASRHTGDTDAGDPLYDTRVYATTDAGASWAAIGDPIDPATLVQTIEVSKSDPQRFYVSGVRGSGPSSAAVFFASASGASAWVEHAIPFDAQNERAPYIAAVDPANADRVYVRNGGPSTSRLFVTTDGGKSFAQKWSGGVMFGFALSGDGSKVWVGGPSDGVQLASTSDFVFAKKSATAVQCLTSDGATLYACAGDKSSGFTVGASTDDGATFAALLHLDTVRGPIACAAGSSAAVCGEQWPIVGGILGAYDAGVEGGAPSAAADAGSPADGGANATTPAPSSSGCGCRAASTADAAPASLSAVAIALAALVGARSRYKKPGKR